MTLQEERKLRVFENMVLRRIFGPRRDEVTGEWRRMHNEELNILLNTMFSNTLSFLSSRNFNDQVLHPYKTTGKMCL